MRRTIAFFIAAASLGWAETSEAQFQLADVSVGPSLGIIATGSKLYPGNMCGAGLAFGRLSASFGFTGRLVAAFGFGIHSSVQETCDVQVVGPPPPNGFVDTERPHPRMNGDDFLVTDLRVMVELIGGTRSWRVLSGAGLTWAPSKDTSGWLVAAEIHHAIPRRRSAFVFGVDLHSVQVPTRISRQEYENGHPAGIITQFNGTERLMFPTVWVGMQLR